MARHAALCAAAAAAGKREQDLLPRQEGGGTARVVARHGQCDGAMLTHVDARVTPNVDTMIRLTPRRRHDDAMLPPR